MPTKKPIVNCLISHLRRKLITDFDLFIIIAIITMYFSLGPFNSKKICILLIFKKNQKSVKIIQSHSVKYSVKKNVKLVQSY